jgi:hypothetical protein
MEDNWNESSDWDVPISPFDARFHLLHHGFVGCAQKWASHLLDSGLVHLFRKHFGSIFACTDDANIPITGHQPLASHFSPELWRQCYKMTPIQVLASIVEQIG